MPYCDEHSMEEHSNTIGDGGWKFCSQDLCYGITTERRTGLPWKAQNCSTHGGEGYRPITKARINETTT